MSSVSNHCYPNEGEFEKICGKEEVKKMKQLDRWEFFIDTQPILIKLDKNGDAISDENDDFVEIPEDTKLTYEEVKNLFAQFTDNLKEDLMDIVKEIPNE